MTLQVKEVNQKSLQMSEELEEMKLQVEKNEAYIKEIASLSDYNEAMSILNDDDIEDIEPNKQQEVIQLLQGAVNLNPKNDKALYKLGYIYSKKRDYTNAISNIKAAIEIKEVADYFYDLGLIYKKQYLVEPAIENILIAIEKEHNVNNKAFYCSVLAVIYSELHNTEKTVATIKQSLDYNYKNIYVYNNISNAYIKIRKYEDAINILEKALKIIPNATTYYNLTEAYIFDNRFEDALNTLMKYQILQNKKDCYGIYEDDYRAWCDKLDSVTITDTIKKIKEIMIKQLAKRERPNGK